MDLLTLAMENGFEHYGYANMDALIPMKEVRDMCEVNRCGRYDNSWACPPACGTLEENTKKLKNFDHCILVQSTCKLTDEFDYDSMKQLEVVHKKRFANFARQMRMLYDNVLPLQAGTCTVCRKCTYPDKPCRYPKKQMVSMEAFGLWVGDVCVKSGLEYNYGTCTMTYTSCVMY